MSRSSTPAYRVEYVTTGADITPYGWRSRAQGRIPADGRPTVANLKRIVDSVAASLLPGGVNHYPTPGRADVRITGGRLVRNDGSNQVLATYTVGA